MSWQNILVDYKGAFFVPPYVLGKSVPLCFSWAHGARRPLPKARVSYLSLISMYCSVHFGGWIKQRDRKREGRGKWGERI